MAVAKQSKQSKQSKASKAKYGRAGQAGHAGRAGRAGRAGWTGRAGRTGRGSPCTLYLGIFSCSSVSSYCVVTARDSHSHTAEVNSKTHRFVVFVS